MNQVGEHEDPNQQPYYHGTKADLGKAMAPRLSERFDAIEPVLGA